MRDFTLDSYRKLLDSFREAGYGFQPFAEYLERPAERAVILRHDVDKRPGYSVRFARIEEERGIRGTYYFRIRHGRWEEEAIREVHALGHEVGYHYETLQRSKIKNQKSKITEEKPAGIHQREDCRLETAYHDFCRNLESLRRIVPVTTVCMHGSPRSKFDNREIWKHYDYRALGITGEPYFDLDTARTAYFTDTGRMWDGERYSVRDKMNNRIIDYSIIQKPSITSSLFHSTFDLIEAVKRGSFPERAMLTLHPQRWTDNVLDWAAERVIQALKNRVKEGMVTG